MSNKVLRVPFTQKLKKWCFNIISRPYIYVDLDYLHNQGATRVIFDYNTAMVGRLKNLGYDMDDPDEGVQEYIATCFESEQMLESGGYGDDEDE